jgi:hypothetical protein
LNSPSNLASHYRGVRYETTWERDLERLRDGVAAPAAIDEVVSEIEPVLSRLGENYPVVGDGPFRVMSIVAARGLPKLEAWFVVEDEKCVACYRLMKVAEDEDRED